MGAPRLRVEVRLRAVAGRCPSAACPRSGGRTCTSRSSRAARGPCPARVGRAAGRRPRGARDGELALRDAEHLDVVGQLRDLELLLELLLVRGARRVQGLVGLALLEREQLGLAVALGLRLGGLQQLVQRVLRRDAAALDDRARDALGQALLEVDEVELAGRADEVEDALRVVLAGERDEMRLPDSLRISGSATPSASTRLRRMLTAWSRIAGVTSWPCSGWPRARSPRRPRGRGRARLTRA